MKLKYLIGAFCVAAVTLTSCEDFFEVSNNTELDSDDYISIDSEMYSGYIGITTRLQAIGDKSVYLTDTRAELLEPTTNTPSELLDIYNYNADLTGNSYANPAGYYDVIIACNDYLKRVKEFKDKNLSTIDMDHYEALVSSAVRVKAWTYLMMAKIYGEIVWFDDPLESLTDLSQYSRYDLSDAVKACRQLLDEGYDGVSSDLSFSWYEWIEPDADQSTSVYRYWDYMSPPYFALYGELCLWDGDYQQTVDLILTEMTNMFASTTSTNVQYMHNANMSSRYSSTFRNQDPDAMAVVAYIMYDYTENQTHELFKHFCTDTPNEYLLAPSTVGRERYLDEDINPGGSSDTRYSNYFSTSASGQRYISKFRNETSSSARSAYESDTPIYMYRSADLYLMLAEALNHVGRYEAASALVNNGIGGTFTSGGLADADQSEWGGFSDAWTPASGRRNSDIGIRNCAGVDNVEFKTKDDLGELTEEEIQRYNDERILNEILLDCCCEGRTLPAMIRMAERYDDYSIIADRVAPKYGSDSTLIRSKIMQGQVFIHYDLDLE